MSHKDLKRLSSAYYRREPQHVDRSRDRYYGTTNERYHDGLKPHSSSHTSSKSHYLSTTSSSSHRYAGLSNSGGGSSSSTRRHSYHQHSSSSHPDYHYDSARGSGAAPSSSSHYSRSGKDAPSKYYHERSPGRSATASARRVPPPLTPPHHHITPLMKARPSSPSSRYRRAPPEDHHHSSSSYRGHGHGTSSRDYKRSSGSGRVDDDAERKIRKRASVPEDESAEAKKKKEVLEDGSTIVDEVTGDGEDECEGEGTEETVKSTEAEAENGKVKQEETATKSEEKAERESVRRERDQDRAAQAKMLLKLYCPYCDMSCVTLREFVYHTKSYHHTTEMTKVVGSMKKKLAQLRITQRDEQKELEKSEDKKDLSDTTSYCRVCELNFRTDPKLHETQPLHNKLKSLVDRTCEVCNIQFKFWKVYIYHVVALEHVKRVALQEVSEKEAKGECIIKGTNLTEEELGMDLMEQRTVFYCNACARYLPIRDGPEETKARHCMSIGHIKLVDEYRQSVRRAERRKLAGEAKEKEKKTEAGGGGGATNESSADTAGEKNVNSDDVGQGDIKNADGHEHEHDEDEGQQEQEEENENGSESTERVVKEEVDEDEIQLHAEEDDSVSANSC